MPTTFPLSVAEFQDKFKISMAEFYPSHPMQRNSNAAGAVVSASLGEVIWQGSFSFPPLNDRSAASREDVLLSILDSPAGSVLLYHPAKTHPAADPDGSILGAATPQIASLDATDARLMGLSGLPAGYELQTGDLIGWQYGSSPVRYALHRIVGDVTADASGEIAEVELWPFIRPGVTVSTAVSLIKPPILAKLVSAPDYGSHRAVVSGSKRMQFVQTIG